MGDLHSANPTRHYLINGTGPDEAVIGFETFPLPTMREFDTTPFKDWVDLLLGRLDSFYTPDWIIKRVLKENCYEDPARERRDLAANLLDGCDRFSEFQRRYSKETITDHHVRMLHHIAGLNGHEIVFPYLTHELFDLSFRAPYYSINDDVSYKNVYKRILMKYFDRDFVYRPKIGFHAPSRRGFREPNGMGALLRQLPRAAYEEFFEPVAIAEEINWRVYSNYAPMDYFLWTSTSLVSQYQLAKKAGMDRL
jgi:hypothetical protein